MSQPGFYITLQQQQLEFVFQIEEALCILGLDYT